MATSSNGTMDPMVKSINGTMDSIESENVKPINGTMDPIESKNVKPEQKRPEKPDEAEYKAKLAAAEEVLKARNDDMTAIKAKFPSPAAPNSRKDELIKERNEIRAQQQTGKTGRTQVMDKIKRLDEQLKAAIAEDRAARSKTRFKSADEVQAEIDRLQAQVDAGTMKIVDERKALGEVSQLNRQKKVFVTDAAGDRISGLKTQIADLRKTLDDPESKAMSDRYTVVQDELDKIRAEQDDAFKNLNALRDERTKAHEAQNQAWEALRALKDDYYTRLRASREYEIEASKIKKAKRDEEQKVFAAERKKAAAQERLEEASTPAYSEEILTAESLVRYLSPDAALEVKAGAPQALDKASPEAPQGTRVAKKDDDDYMVLGGPKKKRGRQHHKAFQLSPAVIAQFAQVGLEPPMGQAAVPESVDALNDKINKWKDDQERKTKENIANAQKEIDALI